MGLTAGTPLRDIQVDTVFLGSCTNGRIEDLRAAADVLAGRKIADGVRMLVVPGSGRVRLQAESEGLDAVFKDAGAEWRGAGCSMCLGMNPDQLAPGERSASTSNRNFEGRQGKGGRTHLVSPLVAAATAVTGTLAAPADLPPVEVAVPENVEDRGIMDAFTQHIGTAAPLRRSNVDTDQIIPAVYLKRVTRTGFEDGLFAAWRNDPTFVLNQPEYEGVSVLVAGPDFGTGSSREHAVWALMDYGFRVVVSARFGDIFRGNSGKAGLLAALVTEDVVEELWTTIENDPGTKVTVDLEAQDDLAPGRCPRRSRSTTTRATGCSTGWTMSASRCRTRTTSRRTRRPGRASSRRRCLRRLSSSGAGSSLAEGPAPARPVTGARAGARFLRCAGARIFCVRWRALVRVLSPA